MLSWSVGNALTTPGGGTLSERLAEWARDHHLGPVVTFGEWLTYQSPKVGGKPSFALTGRPSAPASAKVAPASHATVPPPPLQSLAGRPLPGLGLAIADSIVSSTSGQWLIADSPLGGALFQVSWRRSKTPGGDPRGSEAVLQQGQEEGTADRPA